MLRPGSLGWGVVTTGSSLSAGVWKGAPVDRRGRGQRRRGLNEAVVGVVGLWRQRWSGTMGGLGKDGN